MSVNDILNLEFNVSEIFHSIQGEGTRAGMPCVFIRLQGCELRCSWCDTPYALEIKQQELDMSGGMIYEKIKSYNCNFVEFTGGEPLVQKNILPLMTYLIDEGFTVALETNGHQSLRNVDKRVIKIMDLKCPSSEMTKFNNFRNIEYLAAGDEVKFVIADKTDYDWAVNTLNEYQIHEKVAAVLFSPLSGRIKPVDLAEWILADNLPVRFQLQLHKYIWGPDVRGV